MEGIKAILRETNATNAEFGTKVIQATEQLQTMSQARAMISLGGRTLKYEKEKKSKNGEKK